MSNEATKRQADRAKLQIDLSEVLVVGKDRTPIRCLGVDVTRNGLGIVGFAALDVGQVVLFVANGRGIPLEVVWSRADGVRQGVHHVGLKTKDVAHDLEKELSKAGLLKRVEKYSFPVHATKKR